MLSTKAPPLCQRRPVLTCLDSHIVSLQSNFFFLMFHLNISHCPQQIPAHFQVANCNIKQRKRRFCTPKIIASYICVKITQRGNILRVLDQGERIILLKIDNLWLQVNLSEILYSMQQTVQLRLVLIISLVGCLKPGKMMIEERHCLD